METKPKNRWPRAVGRVIVVSVLSLLLALGVWLALGAWFESARNESRTLKEILVASGAIHPVEATAELCQESFCVEGWKTDYGNYLRFETAGQAEYWGLLLGNEGRRHNRLVLDMRMVNLQFDELRIAVETLYYDRNR